MIWLGRRVTARQPVKPDDHSEVVPLLPIPNRTVKRLCADDSAGSRVKVGHCQANIKVNRPSCQTARAFCFVRLISSAPSPSTHEKRPACRAFVVKGQPVAAWS